MSRGRSAAAILFLLASCSTPPQAPAPKPELTLERLSFADLPEWRDADPRPALSALERSCAVLPTQSTDRLGITGTDWASVCAAITQNPPADPAAARHLVEAEFVPFLAGNHGDSAGFFTGYYEAELRGSFQKGGVYQTPLYRRPPDLIDVDLGAFRPDLKADRLSGRIEGQRLVPYPDRASIEAGALANRGLELLWVDDPVDAFFLEIQGSGRVILPDGSLVRVGYDGQNGRRYVAIGRILADRGVPREQISMAFLRDWIRGHGDEGRALMNENPSKVFFRILSGDGPLGAEGIALTPGASAAIDPHFLPYGVPLWIETTDRAVPGGRLEALFIAQDTGGAIRGPARADLFFGYGARAADHAGGLQGVGRMLVLLPKSSADRRETMGPKP
jgi:membrane-bound lytic murein transglycosylase A